MFERLANGWTLAKESWHVLKQDKELLVLPLLSGIACLLVLASFAVPLVSTDLLSRLTQQPDQTTQIIGALIAFAFYFANYFVIVFFNSALVACAVIRFRGGDPTLSDGLSAAMKRLPQIAGWALVSATVGMILRAIEQRSERVGQFVSQLLGAAWAIGTYFVVPILVIEGVGPIEATKRSIAVLKRTWGEAMAANFGIGAIVFLAMVPAFAMVGGGFYLAANGNEPVGLTLAMIGVLAALLVGLISSAMNAILLAALYLYAADGAVPSEFDNSQLAHAFGQGRGS